jgi:hypothetical protein
MMSAVTELADHLRCQQIEVVALESASVIWGHRGTVCHGR